MSAPQIEQPAVPLSNAELIKCDDVRANGIWPITWALMGAGVVTVLGFIASLCGIFDHAPVPAVATLPIVAKIEPEPEWFSGKVATPPATPRPAQRKDELWKGLGVLDSESATNKAATAAPSPAPVKQGRIISDEKPPSQRQDPAARNDWVALLWDETPSNKTTDKPASQKKGKSTDANWSKNDPVVRDAGTGVAKAELDRRLNLQDQRIAALEAENLKLKTQLQQAQARTAVVQQPNPAPAVAAARPGQRPAGVVVPARPVAPVFANSGQIYGDVGGGHWIANKTDDGSIIVLEDGSVWQVAAIDRIDTRLWLNTTEITVLDNDEGYLPYLLVNTDDGEKAEARYLGRK